MHCAHVIVRVVMMTLKFLACTAVIPYLKKWAWLDILQAN